nr:MAG: RNA-dependent RNA polymerase [Aspergillus flavus magoulivirus 1]
MVTKKVRNKKRNELKSLLASRWYGSNSDNRGCTGVLLEGLVRLEKLRRLLNRGLRLELPAVKRDWTLKRVKGFCEGILEPGVVNEWKSHLLSRHICASVRRTVASALFLFRKALGQEEMSEDEKKKKIQEYIKKMSTPSPIPNGRYLEFVRRFTRRMFPPGWDENISHYLDAFTLPTKSCFENGMSKGGARGCDVKERLAFRDQFERLWSGDWETSCPDTRISIIETGGKYRTVSAFSRVRSYLTPLHKAIYDRLSRSKWLLRGEATPDKFSEFHRQEGEVFVSGDYESATDNLNRYVSMAILLELESTSTITPPGVWRVAHETLRNRFEDGSEQQRGQLMGSVLSFPLLCMQNYFAFRYAIGRKEVPVRINGDDIVFRATQEEADKWFEEVKHSGLVVSKGKTLVLKSCFSLNSSFFHAKYTGCEAIPVIRSSSLFGAAKSASEISGRLSTVYKGNGVLRDEAVALALREMRNQVYASQGSVCRRLGAPISERQARRAGLREREIFYLSLPREEDLPNQPSAFRQSCVPEGYRRVRVEDPEKADDPDFYREMVDLAWTAPAEAGRVKREDEREYWNEMRASGWSFNPMSLSLGRRLLGSSPGLMKLAGHLKDRWIKYRPPFGRLIWEKIPSRATCGPSFVKKSTMYNSSLGAQQAQPQQEKEGASGVVDPTVLPAASEI